MNHPGNLMILSCPGSSLAGRIADRAGKIVDIGRKRYYITNLEYNETEP